MKLYIVIIVLVVSLAIISFKYINRKEQYNLPTTHILLKEYMKQFHKICLDNDIIYWAEGGTLLGTVRNQGIIPHDDDIDVVMFEKDFNKLRKALEGNDKYYIKQVKFPMWKFERKGIDGVWIDIFIIDEEEDKVMYKEPKHRKVWPNMWFKKSEILPLREVDFEDIRIIIPNDPIPYLERCYGSDWRIPKSNGRH